MLKFLRKHLCSRARSYNPIRYPPPGTPAENSAKVLALLAQDFEPVRDRTDEQCVALGRFMSVILLLERKLVRLLSGFDSQIDGRMFGQKIDVYKDFLNAVDWHGIDLELGDYRAIIAPLKEVKGIRDSISHDLSVVSFKFSDLSQTVGYVRAKRPDLVANFSGCADEQVKCLGAVMTFGFVFSEQMAHLQLRVGA
jgi:hypothetical protein